MDVKIPGKQLLYKTLIKAFLKAHSKNFNLSQITPTKGFIREEIIIEGLQLFFWDLSGEKDYRGIWKNYVNQANVIIFTIDGSDFTSDHLKDLDDVCGRLKELRIQKICLLFTKSDKNDFKMLPGLDIIQKHQLLPFVATIDEISYKDPNLVNKMFRLIRYGSY